jgi:hypothetical protein
MGPIVSMRTRGWRCYAVAVALLAVQVSVSALGTIGMCVDRPHTHGGVPAPDCLMHHQQPVGSPPDAAHHGHHHHDNSSSPDTARLTCTCSADPLTLLTTDIAVIPGGIGIELPLFVTTSLRERTTPAPHMRRAPLSPPPKPSFS